LRWKIAAASWLCGDGLRALRSRERVAMEVQLPTAAAHARRHFAKATFIAPRVTFNVLMGRAIRWNVAIKS
jgi:hypothetical protein